MQSLGAVFFVFTLGLICAAHLPAQQRITVSYPGIAGYNIPFWMALDGGEFKKAGLNVEAVLTPVGPKACRRCYPAVSISPLSAAACRCRLISTARIMKTNREATLRVIEKYIHVGSKAEVVKTYEFFVKSTSDTLRTGRDGIIDFRATLEASKPGVSKRNTNEFIGESVLEDVLKGR
jgi:hypothetical protein